MQKNFENKNDAYLYILWCVYKNIDTSKKLSEAIKSELSALEIDKFEFSSKKESGSRIVRKLKQSSVSVLQQHHFKQIEWLQIKNFKSFGSLNAEDNGLRIDMNPNKNIFFAPNGGGKTSLCESIEYKLTGSIKEAIRRGVALKDYIRRDDQKECINVKFANEEFIRDKFNETDNMFFHKCFIEKNRLHEFALLGSKDTGTKEKDVIAAILGLQELDDLVTSFVLPASFKLAILKKYKVAHEIDQLDKSNQNFLIQKEMLEKQIDNEKEKITKLLENKPEDITQDLLEDKLKLLVGQEEMLKLELKELSQRNLVAIEPDTLRRTESIINNNLKRFDFLQSQYNELITKVNYEKFYNILISLEGIDSLENCPACGTPIEQVKTHPFEYAKKEIENLKEISLLQLKLKRIKNRIKNKFYDYCVAFIRSYKENFKVLSRDEYNFDEEINQLRNILTKNKKEDMEIEFVINAMLKFREKNELIFSFVNLVKAQHENQDINSLINTLQEKITSINNDIDTIKNTRTNINRDQNNLESLIKENSSYGTKSALFKADLVSENKYNDFVQSIEDAYKEFIGDLQQFKVEIQSQQINDLGQSVTNYYQSINKEDDDSEYITNVDFVLEGISYKINVTLKDGNVRNAYSCLSEGHLRSLGLSILLAVAEKSNVPFIIFDDVVNAIDSDHRANIIELLFMNEFLKKTQQLITTHDRLFWERYCNTYSQRVNKKDVDKMSFVITYTNKGSVVVQHNVGFEEKIQNALESFDIRQALVYCRIWFETLVTEYCVERGETLSAKFNRKEKNNLLKPSLESIYTVFSKNFPDDQDLVLIKNDLINWSGQNQEHHSFDEHSYNFVHSKSSDEILKIYTAVQRLSFKLFPQRELERLNKRKNQLIAQYETLMRKNNDENFRSRAPKEVVRQHIKKVETVHEELLQVVELLNTFQGTA